MKTDASSVEEAVENASSEADTADTQAPLITHLIELRTRLIRIVLSILAIFPFVFYFANDLYQLVAAPITKQLPAGSTMIAMEVASPFLTPFKLAMVFSIFLAMPMLLYQVWAFVAPGLYQKEKSLIIPLLVSTTLLFYFGAAFAYFVVFPIIFSFFASVAPEGVAIMPDISKYLDFVLKLLLAFGCVFEVPVLTYLSVRSGMIEREVLAKKRPYIIVASFVVGMLLTPPDVISQSLLAIPMWLLFELGLLFARKVETPVK